MYNGVSIEETDSVVRVTNERFAELIRKEEQLNIVTRMLTKGKCVFEEDIKIILNFEKTQEKE